MQNVKHVLGRYVIADRPMTEDEWIRERGALSGQGPVSARLRLPRIQPEDLIPVKNSLGLVEGATENTAVVQALIDNLIERGLDPTVWLTGNPPHQGKASTRQLGR